MSYAETLAAKLLDAQNKVRTNPLEALQSVLEEMPVREKKANPEGKKGEEGAKLFKDAKDAAAKNVLTIVTSIEKSKLAATIKGLTDEERDTLMKFVYRGFQEEYDHMYLLTIHEEICKVSNLGPIIRSIHTRLEV
ncbi:Arp2/3 complex-mediated actin nucleation [Trichomonas vaginalis G3]|uniref:Arp2/3 complex-mediated actin nucleation n=1 Tax=Trichomonas vaginalis (strain ATCC PRA-98 / G3) TaxID=412133 RepID=UPI0021E57D19|nr:Arp2/3 complex-mediated actin nucleation [Trichomonas vaginalis G3]KAI5552337.1 Arp2/3 complex-mediated actin nucleation [Trichomonas vaginalis G3]